MVIHWEHNGIPPSIKDWARSSGTVCKTFWARLRQGQRLTEAQRKQRALSAKAAKAEVAAHAAESKAIRETRAAEEEREAELVRLRDDIMLRWFASDEYRKAERLDKRRQKKAKHRTSGRKDGTIGRRH